MKNITIKKNSVILKLIYLLILIYAIQDFQTSSNIGLRNVDRSSVYISLMFILIVLGANYIEAFIKKRMKMSSFELILWVITVWVLISNILSGNNLWNSLVHIGISLLWILIYSFFYNQIRKYPESFDSIRKFIFIMFLFYVGATIYAKLNIQEIYNRTAVVNYVYYVLVFFPWILLASNKRLRNFSILIIVVMVLISMKRGAIVVFPIMFFVFYFIDGKVNNRRIKNALRVFVMFLLIIVGLVYIDQLYDGYISNRFTYESLASGSGRDTIYTMVINNILNRNIADFLIGLGSGSTTLYIGAAAHNDWLEFIFSFGLIGVFLYMNLFIILIRKTYKSIKNKFIYSSLYAVSIIYMLLIGMVGMIYFAHSTLYLMALFGTLNALEMNNCQKNNE